MVNIKKKIKIIDSLPTKKKKKLSITTILITIILIFSICLIVNYLYTKITPYINATNITKIEGKKVRITECNTKDYIIINKDKSYTMTITDKNCNKTHFEGDIIVKNNEIIFNKKIKGLIDNNYNIIIENNLFESDKNE